MARTAEDQLRDAVHRLQQRGWTRGQIARLVMAVMDLEPPRKMDLYLRWLSTPPDEDRKT